MKKRQHLSAWKPLGTAIFFAVTFFTFVFSILIPQNLLASPNQTISQTTETTIWQESFETNGIGTRYSVTEECTDGFGDYFTRTNGTNIGSFINISNVDGSYFYAAMDTDGAPCALKTEVITFSAVNISGYSSLQFRGMFAEDDSSDGNEDWDDNGLAFVDYRIDGGSWTKILQFAAEPSNSFNTEPWQDTDFDGVGDGSPLTPTLTDFTADIAKLGNSLELRITLVNLDAGDEDIAFDNLRIINVPKFKISKTAPVMIAPGGLFTYTLTITNGTGITPTNTIITDVIPANATFASASDGGVYANGTVTWTVSGDFADGTSVQRTLAVTATSSVGVNVVNEAYGVNATSWLTTAVGSPVTTTVSPGGISVEKSGPQASYPGGTLVYTVTVDNLDTNSVSNVLITDTFPSGVTYISDNSGLITNVVAPPLYSWNIPNISGQGSVSFNITATVDSGVSPGTDLVNTFDGSGTIATTGLVTSTTEFTTTVYPVIPITTVQQVADPATNGDSPFNGQVVWVEGVVTSVPGDIGRQTEMMVIQDARGGPWSGLTLFRANSVGGLSGVTASEGTIVRALGTVDEFFGFTQLNMSSDPWAVEIIGSTTVPTPEIISTNDYGPSAPATAEQWESVLIQFNNATVTDGDIGFGEWAFDDGSGPANADDLGDDDGNLNYAPADGDPYAYIRGIGYYSFGNYKLAPRADTDIAFTMPEVTKSAPSIVDSNEVFTYTISVNNWTGIDLTNVTLTDTVPLSATFKSASDSGQLLGGTVVSWTIPSIANLTTIQRTFQVTATSASTALIVNDDFGVVASNFVTVTKGAAVSTAVFDNQCGGAYTSVYDIQGSGSASPFPDGTPIVTEGIVTADFQGSSELDGFFIQDESGDADTATSDGIFVFAPGSLDVNVGDKVRVGGQVDEFFGLTEINNVGVVLNCGTGSINPVQVTLPLSDTADLEAVEGMLVEFPQELTATEVFNLGRFGQVSLSANGRLMNPTNVVTPGLDANNMQAENDLNRILLDDASNIQNPDPIVYPTPELSATNSLRTGDTITGLLGVVDYAFGDYRVQPTATPNFVAANGRPTEAPDVGGSLTVASFNVLNYFNGDGLGGGFPTARGASSLSEFNRQRDKIINAILEMNADVIGLMEIENDGYDANSAIQDLVNGLNAASPVTVTYDFVDPLTNTIGTDAIAVGLLYRTETITLTGSPAILDSTVISTFNDDKNRPALAQAFVDRATNTTFVVAVNHLKSKGSDCDSLGDPDTGDGQGNCNLTRKAAAEALATWLAANPTGVATPYSLIIGDLNSYAKEDPITALKDAGYTDLIDAFIGAANAYSFVFAGQAGYLDHALSNPALTPYITGASEWHINADEPRSLDYNEEFKSSGQVISLYNDDVYRSSDHDPVIVGIKFPYRLFFPIIGNNATFSTTKTTTMVMPESVDTPTQRPLAALTLLPIMAFGMVPILRKKD